MIGTNGQYSAAVFYLKLVGQVLLIAAAITGVGAFDVSPGAAAGVGIVAFVWLIWLVASLVRHLTR